MVTEVAPPVGKAGTQALGPTADQRHRASRLPSSNFKHAVAKNVFSMLDNFAWWRVIRMLKVRHHWRWTNIRRQFTDPTGRWLPITAGEIELRRAAAIPVTRYRYRGNTITTPGPESRLTAETVESPLR